MTENVLFHVTLSENVHAILRTGVDPAHSQGAKPVSWYVDRARLDWALAHCSARRGVPVSLLIVCEVVVPPNARKKTRWQGVYTVDRALKPHFQTIATHYLVE